LLGAWVAVFGCLWGSVYGLATSLFAAAKDGGLAIGVAWRCVDGHGTAWSGFAGCGCSSRAGIVTKIEAQERECLKRL
jgi:hypothetical protein